MAITHTLVNTNLDNSNTTLVHPGDWNADHVIAPGSITQQMLAPGAYVNYDQVAQLRWYDVNRTGYAISTQPQPWGGCFDGQNIWVANYGASIMSKINVNTLSVANVTVAGSLTGCCFDGQNIWATNTAGLYKVLASTGATVGTYTMPYASYANCCFDGQYVWTANYYNTSVTKFNTSGGVVGTYPVGGNAYFICFDGTYIWTYNYSSTAASISKVLASNGTLAGGPYSAPNESGGQGGICYDGKYIWAGGTSVAKYDPSTGTRIQTISTLGGGTWGMCSDGYYVWTGTGSASGYINKIRCYDGALIATPTIGGTAVSPCYDGVRTWAFSYGGNTAYIL
jgi:hypothetical protein